MPKRPILIAYDGSEFARTAIREAAGQLKNGRRAIVLTVWQPYIPGFAGSTGVMPAELGEQLERDAWRVAREGAELARTAGFDAHAVADAGDPVWQRIVESVEEREVDMVVIGSHGRSGIARALLGSVAEAVASHTERPVLIVHDPNA